MRKDQEIPNPQEKCAICGIEHKNKNKPLNEWHIHHGQQVICLRHLDVQLTEEALQQIREEDKKSTDHPEWFPPGRKNLGMRNFLNWLYQERRRK